MDKTKSFIGGIDIAKSFIAKFVYHKPLFDPEN